jgi:transketolase C-terminal domain/subunit
VIEAIFDQANSFSEGLAAVSRKNGWGYINTEGKEIIPIRYSYADAFSEGHAKVMMDGKWLEIDKTGKTVKEE